MTREELYQSIFTHDTIYIPPHEEGDAPLEVALGCSWHRCTFCDFAKDTFLIHPLEHIERNLQVLGMLQPDNEQLFMLGENAFVMSTDYICRIAELARHYMPRVKQFAMYSRIDDILNKTDEDLHLLHSKGLRALHIGVESGSDSILAARNKGITSAQTVEALLRLDAAGIDYCLTVILGLGGRTFSRLHALETASMLNKVHPKNIWCLKLKLWEGTLLYKEEKQGLFDMISAKEMLLEEYLILENLTVEGCLYEDTTVLGKYTIQGVLPRQKQLLLDAVRWLLHNG